MVYDGGRPFAIQKILWNSLSQYPPHQRETYVASPSQKSIHNYGCAVDLTITTSKGVPLDMGTPFDFFGPEASHDYKDFSKEIIANRALFKKIMISSKFQSFDSEWWHYNLKNAKLDPISNFKWNCN